MVTAPEDCATERHLTSAPRTVIFDLDRTLTTCDSFAGCLNGLLLRQWWRVGAVVAAGPVIGVLWAVPATRSAALRALLWCATVGMTAEALDSALSSHGEWLASRAESTVHRDGLHVLRAHQQAGDRVVIVTGSSEILARAFCAALGIHGVTVVGSSFVVHGRAWTLHEHCVGHRKVALLETAGITPPWAVVYTDSASDLPLLQLAERRCLVNPTRSSVRTVRRILGDRCELLEWR